jgi:hypothetical protein
LEGGFNLFLFTINPTKWIDPLGLAKMCDIRKRTVAEVAVLREAFDRSGGARDQFLINLAKDPKSLLKYGADAVADMAKGKNPKDLVVHHKKPLFRGGANCDDNLVLLDGKYHKDNNKALHYYEPGQNPYGIPD